MFRAAELLCRDLRFERARGHEFRHQDDALVAFDRGLPGVVEADDVGVLQALQHLHLLTEALPLCLGQLAGLQRRETKRNDSVYCVCVCFTHTSGYFLSLFFPDVNVANFGAGTERRHPF